MDVFLGAALPADEAGLGEACDTLGIGAAELWAVVYTETDGPTQGAGFWPSRRPQILYEQHVFHRLTHGAFDASNPDISNARPGNYGATGEHQYDRLREAARCDHDAAIESASWGIGQTLGENFREAGFATVDGFLGAMLQSESTQLAAVAAEITATGAAAALREHRWADFAQIYNGPNFRQNHYDTTLAGWYELFTVSTLPDLTIRAAQLRLSYLGFDPHGIDGRFGRMTRSAMQQYQRQRGLPETESLDEPTAEALRADVARLAG